VAARVTRAVTTCRSPPTPTAEMITNPALSSASAAALCSRSEVLNAAINPDVSATRITRRPGQLRTQQHRPPPGARYAPARRTRYALKSGVLDAPPSVLVGEVVVGQVEPVQGVARGVMWMAVGQRSAIWKLWSPPAAFRAALKEHFGQIAPRSARSGPLARP
jgi:hypothetical protein